MFEKREYGKQIRIGSGTQLLEICKNQEIVRQTVPENFEMLLPRVMREPRVTQWGQISEEEKVWFAECWWRSAETGVLGYYTKINLETGMLKVFRELPGDQKIVCCGDPQAWTGYLESCVEQMTCDNMDPDTLNVLWAKAAGPCLPEVVCPAGSEQKEEEYFLPLEVLTQWNWEKVKPLMLERYDTTVEEILDYAAYLDSESELRYIPPKYRAEAKEKGLRFWENEHDI